MDVRKRIAHVSLTSVLGLLVMNAALAAPCADLQHRAFDFWIGEWQVRTPDGKLAGVNRIEREYGGCVLHERYDTRAQVTCDGVVFGELTPSDQLQVAPGAHRITLLHPPGYDYFRLLRSKLHWGRGGADFHR